MIIKNYKKKYYFTENAWKVYSGCKKAHLSAFKAGCVLFQIFCKRVKFLLKRGVCVCVLLKKN